MDGEKIQTDIDSLLTYMNDEIESVGATLKTFHLDLMQTTLSESLLMRSLNGQKNISTE